MISPCFKTFLIGTVLLLVMAISHVEPGLSQSAGQAKKDSLVEHRDGALMAVLNRSRYGLRAQTPALHGSDAEYAAVNYAQGFRARFTSTGLQLAPRATDAPTWNWALTLSGYGYGDALEPVGRAEAAASQDRIEYRHKRSGKAEDAVIEWYVNRAQGIEHGFTLPRPPRGPSSGEPLHLALTVTGDLKARAVENGTGIEFITGMGAPVLHYSDLHVFDARGRQLSARLQVKEARLSVLVDDSAAVYPLVIDPLIYSETKLTASKGSSAGDSFGFAVASTGNTLVIGSPGDESQVQVGNLVFTAHGSAYIFVRAEAQWVLQARLVGNDTSDAFGASVAIDGDTVVVGDPTGNGMGMAYIFGRRGNSWIREFSYGVPPLPVSLSAGFGTSVAVDGNTVVIGAPFLAIQPLPNQGNFFGNVRVFVRRGNSWTSQASLLASDGADFDAFGTSVAISDDTIVVGAPGDDSPSGAGSAYVYVRTGQDWAEQSHLFASDVAFGDQFGTSVGISSSTIIVGAPFDDTAAGSNAGSAYVYIRNVNDWIEQAHLFASDGASNDRFGSSVAVSPGNAAAIGAPFDNTAAGTNAGSVYVYTRVNAIWSEQAHLFASDGAAEDQFGGSVAVDYTKLRNRILVGASGDNTAAGADAGSAYFYDYQGSALSDVFEDIHDWFLAGTLQFGEAYALTAQINAFRESLDQGNFEVARNRLQDFVRQVARYVDGRILSPAQGQALIDAANLAGR